MIIRIYYTYIDDEKVTDYVEIITRDKKCFFSVNNDAESIIEKSSEMLEDLLKRMGEGYYETESIEIDGDRYRTEIFELNEFNQPTAIKIYDGNDNEKFQIVLGMDSLIFTPAHST